MVLLEDFVECLVEQIEPLGGGQILWSGDHAKIDGFECSVAVLADQSLAGGGGAGIEAEGEGH